MQPAEPRAGFEAFALGPKILSVLKELGYEEPTPIQRATIPALLEGRDVLGQAATGTGKTAAFALPMVSRIAPHGSGPFQTQGLVLVPTRELAMQVSEAITRYGTGLGVRALAIYGGQEFHLQLKPLKKGVDVVVATPGRALDHLRRKTLKLDKVTFVVLDEADEMLDMGFAEDLEAILSNLPKGLQTALFSATLPSRIVKIAEKHLENPVRVTIAPKSADAGTLPIIRQAAYIVPRGMKESALVRVLEVERPTSALVFCRTRVDVDLLTSVLGRLGYGCAALHGGMTQEQRDAVLRKFKSGAVKVLVATDVAARGLHVDKLSHVINYDLPTSPEPYVHRIGRTGRAGEEGVALSFLEQRELRLLGNIERLTKKKIPLLAVPSGDVLARQRHEAVAALVKEALTGDVDAFLPLLKSFGTDVPLERVAAAALSVLQKRLFPPQVGEDVEFPSTLKETRRPTREVAARGRTGPASASAGPGPRRFEPGAPARPAGQWPNRGVSERSEAPARGAARTERPSKTVWRDEHSAVGKHRGEHAAKSAPKDEHAHKGPPRDDVAPLIPDDAEGASPSAWNDEFSEPGEGRGEAPAKSAAVERSEPAPRGAEAPAKGTWRDEAPSSVRARADVPARPAARHERPAKRAWNDEHSEMGAGRPPKGADRPASRPRGQDTSPPPRRSQPAFRRTDDASGHQANSPVFLKRERGVPPGASTWLFLSLGERAGLRPQDVVGAIANEAGVPSKSIGEILINAEVSRVQVPVDLAPRIIEALRATKLRGRRFKVDFDRSSAPPPATRK